MENSKEFTSSASSFPIIFFNGIKEVNVGNILLLPSKSYKTFKSTISLKLKIPSQRILTYLVRQNNATSPLDARSKVQINEFSNFALITEERSCFILAILKRFPTKWWNVDVPIPVGLRHWNYESELEYKRRQREKYPMIAEVDCRPLAMVGTPTVKNINTSSKIFDAATKSRFCKECTTAKEEGLLDDFHCCMNDEIIMEFHTTVGPIQ